MSEAPHIVDVESTIRTERSDVTWTPTRPTVIRTSNFPLAKPEELPLVHSTKGLLGIFRIPKEAGFDAWILSSVAFDPSPATCVSHAFHESVLRRTEHLFKIHWAPPVRVQLWWRDPSILRTMATFSSTRALNDLYETFGHPLHEAAWLARGLTPRRTMAALQIHPDCIQLWLRL